MEVTLDRAEGSQRPYIREMIHSAPNLCDAYLGNPYPSYYEEPQSAVIPISWGSTGALPSSWDKGWPDKHPIGSV